MANHELQINPQQILMAIHQHLSEHFFSSTKTNAKQTFNQLNDGKGVPLLQITSDQQGDVTGVLALDSSEFVGSLNFSTFRDALGSHLNQVLERLQKEDDDLSIFTAEDTGAMLFHIPGIVESDGQHNFLVTAIEQDKPGTIIIKLMFLNPDTYTRKDA